MLDTSSTLCSCTVPPFCPALLHDLTAGEKYGGMFQVPGCESSAPNTLSLAVSLVSTDNILTAPLLRRAGLLMTQSNSFITIHSHSVSLLLPPPHPRRPHPHSPQQRLLEFSRRRTKSSCFCSSQVMFGWVNPRRSGWRIGSTKPLKLRQKVIKPM